MNRNNAPGTGDLRGLASALASVDDPARMLRLLRELHTPAELRALGLRWRLLAMLDRGLPQREIAGRLGVSLCKITRGSRILKARGSAAKGLIERPL